MIDLETLGTRPDAQIIQIGAVLFEPKSGGRIHDGKGFRQAVKIQDGAGSIDHDTLCFWLNQSNSNYMGNLLAKEALLLDDVLQRLIFWPRNVGLFPEGEFNPDSEISNLWSWVEGIWAKPSNFDLPILQSAFALFGMEPPWDHRATRCARTLFALVGGDPEIDWTGLIRHDALDDAIGQAQQVQKAMAILEGS
jgi:exodeoxyribonuclease VIII